MLAAVRSGACDLAVGTRDLTPEGVGKALSPMRQAGSRLANWLARQVLKAELSDPVSGFFVARRDLIDRVAPRLSSQGFKVLFDIIASQPSPPRIAEFSYVFAERHTGDSKMDGRVIIEYLGLVLAKLTGNLIPPRALIFFLVGATGLVVQLAMVSLCRDLGLTFMTSQVTAALTAMTSNFLINNMVTYRDRRLRGLRLLTGYVRFCGLCGVGMIANVAVANLVHQHTPMWLVASAAGAFAGAAWNYVSTSLAVW
jgi:dolichol-phosphate mannosyltransferase